MKRISELVMEAERMKEDQIKLFHEFLRIDNVINESIDRRNSDRVKDYLWVAEYILKNLDDSYLTKVRM